MTAAHAGAADAGWWRAPRVGLRAALTALIGLVLLAPTTGVAAVVGGVLGAGAGVLVGEVLASTRVRGPVAFVGALGLAALGALLGWLFLAWSPLALALGPSLALRVGGFATALVGLCGLVGALRIGARRVPALAAVELGALALAITLPFAAHRGGDLARPLWLADAAWSLGFDPGHVMLAIGAVAGACIASIQLLETRHRLPLLGWVWIPVIALLAYLVADARTSEPPPADALRTIQEGPEMGPPATGGDAPSDAQADANGDGSTDAQDGDTPRDEGGGGGSPPGEGAAPQDGDDGSSGGGAAPQDGDDGSSGGGAAPQDGDDESSGGGAAPQDGDDGSSAGGKPEDEGEGGGAAPQDGDDGGEAAPRDGDDGGADGGARPPDPSDLQEHEQDAPSQDSPVAVVLLGDDYEPLQGYYYLRQIVQSEFAGTRMVPATRDDVDRDVLARFPVAPTWMRQGPPQQGRKKVHGRVALLAEHDAPFALDAPFSYAPAPNPDVTRFVRAYHFVSLAPVRPYEELFGRGLPDLEPEILSHYLAYPEHDPRYLALAESLLEQVPAQHRDDPFVRALVVKQHLDQMRYTRKRRHADAPDPTASFLFGDLTGYCVHAAHAAVYLMRALGVPSRIGTGYAVEADRRRGSSIVVMGADAHAWPEILLADEGWVILDISPSEDLDESGEPLDEALASLLSDMARDTSEPTTSTFPLRRLWSLAVRTLTRALIALVVLIVLLHYVVKAWRRARPLVATERVLPRAGYRLALDRLAEAGFVREHGETRERFARRVGPIAPSFEALTALHLAARLGPPDAAPPPRARWRDLLAAMRRELRAVPWWRRLVGLTDPTSFYRSR